jgi:hypothetical protein
VHCHPILEPRAQQRVYVRVCRSIRPTMLVDREDTLRLPQSPAEGLVDGVAQDARREVPVKPLEARGRRVVHGQDEAKVDRVSETSTVLAESPPDGPLVAAEGTIALANP